MVHEGAGPADGAAPPPAGYVDAVETGAVRGWARGENGPVEVRLLFDGECVGTARADRPRPDVGSACGFRIEPTRTLGAADFLVGRAWAEAGGERLSLSDPAGLAETVIAPHIPAMPGIAFREMIGRALLGRPWLDRAPAAIDPRVTGEALSSFALPVGTVSPDAEVIVGHGGHMFLITGSNGLIGQYDRAPDTDEIAARWLALFERRRSALAERGIDYLQLVIPEKASVLAELLPFAIRPPTPLLAAVQARVAASPMAARCPDLFAAMTASPEREQLYLRIDSHLTCRGAAFLFGRVLEHVGVPMPSLAFTQQVRSPGNDLAYHFPWTGFVEHDVVPAALPVKGNAIERLEEYRPARHYGTRLVFRNPNAPIARRVVAFANSFFMGGRYPQMMSWWMIRWFKEFHFVWSSEVELDYVDRVRPDLVIAQTVERFLPVVPAA